jgi:hypothetical protein
MEMLGRSPHWLVAERVAGENSYCWSVDQSDESNMISVR